MKTKIEIIKISQTVHGILLTKTTAFKVLRSVWVYFEDKMKMTVCWLDKEWRRKWHGMWRLSLYFRPVKFDTVLCFR